METSAISWEMKGSMVKIKNLSHDHQWVEGDLELVIWFLASYVHLASEEGASQHVQDVWRLITDLLDTPQGKALIGDGLCLECVHGAA